MDECFLIPKRNGGGGGTIHAARSLIVRRGAAIGDVIAATCVADKLIEQGFQVEFQSHAGIHGLLRRHPSLTRVNTLAGDPHVDLDGVYETHPDRKTRHFHDLFFESANRQLERVGLHIGTPKNCKPRLSVRENERQAVRVKFEQYEKPWAFICPASKYWNVREVPPYIWKAVAEKLPGTCFWLGEHPAPEGIVDLKARQLDNVVEWLSVADLLVTVDTGPMHIAAALNVPIVAISQSSSPSLHLNDQNDFIEVSPTGLDCLNCQLNVCPKDRHMPPCQKVDPDLISNAVNSRLRSLTSEDVTAVVPVYQPDVRVLNRCLEQVVSQVAEVVVTAEAKSIIPAGAMQHPKIRYVRTPQSGIGFGRNVNFGARHANGKYLLILNDDVYLDSDAVGHMMREMTEGVGIVVHFLRYESGLIWPTVCARRAGDRDWFHVDHLRYETSIPKVIEAENACGASWLIRRKAFFEVGGYDERYFAYCEDNHLSLSMRRAGWKIVYTPHAKGVHVGHQSFSKLGNIADICGPSIQLFQKIWKPYLEHNRNRVPLGDFNY